MVTLVPQAVVAVLVGLAVCQVAIVLTTVYLHRTISHRSVTMVPAVRAVCRVLLWVTTGIRPRQWAAVHRRHHAHTDAEGDPHSPVLDGFWKVLLGNVGLYRHAIRDGVTVDRYAKDIPPDAWDRYLFDHSLLGLSLGIGALCLLLGWEWGLVAAAVHTVSYLLLNGAVNAVGHSFGRQPYPNKARNTGWLALLTAGEGWHNNHHAAPTSARLGRTRREVDFGWWLIQFLVWRRWATVRLTQARPKATAPSSSG
jgi:stearoyl-CoA desaturase (delta-9 desaturase)